MMTHHHLAFQRANRFKCNTYNDKHCCSAEGNVPETCNVLEDDGENCDERKENCADKCNLREGVLNEIRRGLAGTDTRNSSVVFLKIIGNFYRIILNSDIEVVESYNQQEVENCVKPAALAEESYKALPEIVAASAVAVNSEEHTDCLGKRHN